MIFLIRAADGQGPHGLTHLCPDCAAPQRSLAV